MRRYIKSLGRVSRDGAMLDNPTCEQMLRICIRVNGEYQVNLCLRPS